MKKKWMLLVSIAAIAVMVFGAIGTGAWFTDVKTIENNVITTGTMTLTAWGGPLTVENLEPGAGYKSAGVFCARNDGNYDLKFRGKLIYVDDAKGLRDYVQLKATLNPVGNQGTYGLMDYLVFQDVNYTELMATNAWMDIKNEQMHPGDWACWLIEARLLGSAPNGVQGATLKATLELHATQWIDLSY